MEPVRAVLERVLPPILKYAICPRCKARGGITLFDEPANGGIGLFCGSCSERHPFSGEHLMWVPQNNKRRPNAIASLPKDAERRCYICGLSDEQLEKVGRALQSHHADPYVGSGKDGTQIPLCTECHEIARARQHAAGRLIQKGVV